MRSIRRSPSPVAASITLTVALTATAFALTALTAVPAAAHPEAPGEIQVAATAATRDRTTTTRRATAKRAPRRTTANWVLRRLHKSRTKPVRHTTTLALRAMLHDGIEGVRVTRVKADGEPHQNGDLTVQVQRNVEPFAVDASPKLHQSAKRMMRALDYFDARIRPGGCFHEDVIAVDANTHEGNESWTFLPEMHWLRGPSLILVHYALNATTKGHVQELVDWYPQPQQLIRAARLAEDRFELAGWARGTLAGVKVVKSESSLIPQFASDAPGTERFDLVPLARATSIETLGKGRVPLHVRYWPPDHHDREAHSWEHANPSWQVLDVSEHDRAGRILEPLAVHEPGPSAQSQPAERPLIEHAIQRAQVLLPDSYRDRVIQILKASR